MMCDVVDWCFVVVVVCFFLFVIRWCLLFCFRFVSFIVACCLLFVIGGVWFVVCWLLCCYYRMLGVDVVVGCCLLLLCVV